MCNASNETLFRLAHLVLKEFKVKLVELVSLDHVDEMGQLERLAVVETLVELEWLDHKV